MEISLIGENAGKVWNALNEHGECEMAQLKKATALSEAEIAAAIGWPEKKRFRQQKQRKVAGRLFSSR